MKKLFCVILFISMVYSLVGCNYAAEPSSVPSSVPSSPTQTDSSSEPDAIGGFESIYTDYKYVINIHSTASVFIYIVGIDAFEDWVETVKNTDESTIIGFINHFQISKEDFKAAHNQLYEPKFTDEEIDVIYSNDKALIADHFMNPNCIRVGDEIYTPKWLATHSLDQVKAAGITAEAIESSMNKWEGISENTEVYANTKALLDQYQAETESTD